MKSDVWDRFWEKVQEPFDAHNDCWEWKGARSRGYGAFKADHRVPAHRFAYEQFYGPIPQRTELHHICEKRECVNPAHLQPVSRKEHVELSPLSVVMRQRAQTHCKRGHPLSGDNLYMNRGRRNCRECLRMHWRNRTKRKRNQ